MNTLLRTFVRTKTALACATLMLTQFPADVQALPDYEPLDYASGVIVPAQADSGGFVFFQRNAANVQPNAVIAAAAVAPPVDTTPPVMHCPPGTNIVATSGAGAVLNYSVTATDDRDQNPTITCSPASSTTFPLGTTTVACAARDASGNVSRCTFTVTVTQPPPPGPEYYFSRNLLPPTNGLLITLPKSPVTFANGLIVRDLRLGSFSPSMPPPPSGGSQIQKFEGIAQFEHSTDGGQTFSRVSAPAFAKVMVSGASAIGTITTYDTEMIELDILDGTLPPGVMFRESPSKASLGRTSVRSVPNGYMISGFFDVFPELSLDGGQTWSPVINSSHLELRVDPASFGQVTDPAQLLPPPTDMYASPPQLPVTFAQGIVLKDIRNKYFTSSLPPPKPGEEQTYQFGSQMDMQLSLDGGNTFKAVRAPASAAVHLANLGSSAEDGLYDTEMLALNIQGGDLPQGMMLRESPTLPSRGGMRMNGQSDGSSTISSFFDIFTELSFDGGQTWSPAQQPLHIDLRKVSTGHVFTTQNLPPLQGQYISGPPWFSAYANGIIISNISQNLFTQSQPPPPPSGSQIQQFSSSISMMLSLNGGQSWSPVTAVANAAVQLASSMDANGTRFFNTEMLTLNIGGGTLPQGVLFRESPSKASLGRTSLKTNPASGQTLMESFFDIFTEVTIDGGQNWNAAVTTPGTVGVTPNPIAAFTIYCPSNMTVTATGTNGAAVNFLTTYLFPDCPFGPFVVTCTPPSGSIFPVGTTAVHCVGSDGCGEHPTCSFNVTVRPRLQFSGVINSIIGKAVLQPVYPPNPGPPPHLRVSNLGSSGQDGFSIDAVGAESVLVNFLPFPVDVGTCAVSRVLGPSDLKLSEGTFFGGASPNVHADFSGVGASQCLVQVRDEFNNLIHSSVRQNGAIVDVNSFFPNPCPNGTSFYSISQGADFVWYKFCRVGCFCSGTNCTIERAICLRGINPSLLQKIATLEIRAQGVQNPSSMEVLSEEFEKFGRYHLALGDAALTGADRRLDVRNLGSSGQDGVSVDFLPNGGGAPDPVDRYRMRLLPVEINCPGACLRLSATGDFAGDPKHALGSASMTYDGQGNLQLNVDFSPIGSKSTRVDVYEGSKFVGTASVQGNFIGTLSGGGRLIACGKLPPPLPCFFGGFETTFKFAAADGTSLVGDEIRILAGNPSGALKNLASFSVQACNVERITILDELLPEPPPRLTIAPLGSTAGYRICWSTTSSGLALQCSRGLEAPILWETVTNQPQVTLNTNYCVSLTGAQVGQRRFYRVAGAAQ